MKFQNHCDIILKYQLTITHGTANITYLFTHGYPRQSRNYLRRIGYSFLEKGFIFEIFLLNEDERPNKISFEVIPTLTYVKYTKHCFYKNEEKSEISYQVSQT